MPAPSDIARFMRGQLLQTPSLPVVSFAGKTIAITGGNTGLGFECAKQLISLGLTKLIIGCRDLRKGEAAMKELRALASSSHTTVDIQVWHIDMASFASVKGFAKRLQFELSELDALLCNAGISVAEFAMADGFESTLTVNVISTFLLAALALPKLQETAVAKGSQSHLTIVGSNVHCFAAHEQLQQAPEGKMFETLSDPSKADMAARYFLSKLVVMLATRALAARISSRGDDSLTKVVVNCPSPGWCKTSLFRSDDGGFVGRNMLKLIGRTAETGARCLTSALAAGPETHGEYLSECHVKPTSVFVRSLEGREMQEKLWLELVDIMEGIAPGAAAALR